jgi:hypothetical protein
MRTPSGSDPFDFIGDLTMFLVIGGVAALAAVVRLGAWSEVGVSEIVGLTVSDLAFRFGFLLGASPGQKLT